ncbi:MAG: hypothetical protein ACI8X5_003493, partial [Planctomycetota bacterium]
MEWKNLPYFRKRLLCEREKGPHKHGAPLRAESVDRRVKPRQPHVYLLAKQAQSELRLRVRLRQNRG